MSKEVDNLREQRELFQLRSHLQDFASLDWQVRIRAIGALTQVKKTTEFYEEALPIIITACTDESDLVRQAAIPFLGDLGGGGEIVISTLHECINRKDESEVKAAVYSLGKIGPDAISTITTLISLLEQNSEDLHKAISWSLSMLGPEAVPPLISSCDSTNIRTQLGCINALSNMGPMAESSINTLIKKLEHESALIRNEAAKAIGNLRAVPSISNCIPQLKAALEDNDPDVRWASAEALRKIGTEDAMEAWASYQEIGTTEAYIKQLTNPDKAVRLHAAESLYSVLTPEATVDFTIIKKALNDPYSKVPIALCVAIARLEDAGKPLEETLVTMLSNSESTVRAAAAQCLGKINATSPATVNELIKHLADSDKEVRLGAGLALELLDTIEAKTALKRFKWE